MRADLHATCQRSAPETFRPTLVCAERLTQTHSYPLELNQVISLPSRLPQLRVEHRHHGLA